MSVNIFMTSLSNNKHIAKNTLMLYIRMLLSMAVSLYTSRVVLNTLGVEDYGIYNVVGGVVAMFGFLNATMSGATSRFLTFELGKGNYQRLKDTFSSALLIHIAIAIVILVVAETIGLWFLNTKLVIPETRMTAAHWVYQFSIISSMVTITQVPYNASILSHERMDVYAYVEILNVSLKLLIVYLLLIGHTDKLILYSVLTLAVSVIIALVYRIYCLRHFDECHFRLVWDRNILRPMLSFSGWDLYGNMCVTARAQGTNFLLNIFFGPKLNASAGIATTVQGILLGFAYNVVTAFRPQIIKAYAKGEIDTIQSLLHTSLKFSLALLFIMLIPLYWELDYILGLWLGIVPEYTVDFLHIILTYLPLNLINNLTNIPIHATGNIKTLSFISGTIFLLTLLPTYIFFKLGFSPTVAYAMMFVAYIFTVMSNSYLIYRQIGINGTWRIIMKVLLSNLIVITFISTLILFLQQIMQESFMRLFIVCIISTVLYCFCFYALLLKKNQRDVMWKMIKAK